MLLNGDVVDKRDGLSSPIFVVVELSGLFLNTSTFSIKHSRSA